MNKEWSLDVLYTGYDDPKFAADEAELDRLIREFANFAADLKGDPKDGLQERINRLKYLYEEDERRSREFRQKIEEERKRQEELEKARESGDPDSIDIMDPGEDHDQQERKER